MDDPLLFCIWPLVKAPAQNNKYGYKCMKYDSIMCFKQYYQTKVDINGYSKVGNKPGQL